MSKLQNNYIILVCLTVVLVLSGTYFERSRAAVPQAAAFQNGFNLTSDLIGAHSVTTADLNLDGKVDVVAAGRESGRVVWYANDGGAFPQFTQHEVGFVQGVYMVVTADLDGDGDADIVATAVDELMPSGVEQSNGAVGALVWFQNNLRSEGGFTAHTIAGALPYAVAVHAADLDRDGDLDLLSAARDGNRIAWYENIGGQPPTFIEREITTNALAVVSVGAGDLDGDGDLDIFSASEDDNKIAWYLNDGNHPPNFIEAGAYTPGAPPPNLDYAKDVIAADLDGDGDLDLAYVGEDNNEVGWLENLGGSPPTFIPHIIGNDIVHGKTIFAADIEGDGDIDLLVASSGDNKITHYINDGGSPPTFTPLVVTNSALGARAVHAADLDGDGDLDILSASRDDHRIVWYPNRKIHRTAIFNEATQTVVEVRPNARNVYAVDMDKDGDTDLLAVTENVVLWYENNGASPPGFIPHEIANNISGGRWVAAGDLDGDGDMDVVAASKRTNQISWYENLGGSPPAFAWHIVTQDARGARAALIADLNGDGHLDIYSASDTDNAISWYQNNGARPPTFTRHIVSRNAAYARSVYAADLDGDGDLDLMSASQNDHKVAWYENLGGEPLEFFERAIDMGAGGVLHIHADDLDGDGDMDLLAALEYDNSLRWYENLGGTPPAFQMHFVSTNTYIPHAIHSGDFDQDGDIDLVAAIEGTNMIAWFENDGSHPPRFTERTIVNNTLVAHGVYVADVDNDGDLDVISASREDGKIAWYENLGGQYTMSAELDMANSSVTHIFVTSRGRTGDPDLAVAHLDLQLLDDQQQPLTSQQANQLIRQIDVYRTDCCEKVVDPARHPLLASLQNLELEAGGHLFIRLVDGDANTLVPAGGTTSFAVVIHGADNACVNGVRSYRVNNIASSGVALNSETDQPLLAEYVRAGELNYGPPENAAPVVMINEFLADNDRGLEDPDDRGEYPDWIELYNSAVVPIDLSGKYLTDDLTNPTRHRIADGVIIPPRGHLVFYADGEPQQGPLHLNFKLERNGESIGLFEADAGGIKKLDEVVFGPQLTNVSTGRFPDGSARWREFDVPTPGRANIGFVTTSRVHLPFLMRELTCE